MRSYLLVRGDDLAAVQNALASHPDALVFDLEASVAPARRRIARGIIVEALLTHKKAEPLFAVRVNALGSQDLMDDLAAIMPARPSAILLAACRGCADIQHLAALLAVYEAEAGSGDGSTRIIATLFSTAQGMLSRTPLDDARNRLHGVTWEAQRLSANVGAAAYWDEHHSYTAPFQLARSLTLFSAHAAQVVPIDTPFADIHDLEGLEADCVLAKRDGFGGKFALHPSQVPIIHRVFSKDEEG